MAEKDRFGNEMDPMVGFAWGSILKGPAQLNYKALHAQDVAKKRADKKGIGSLVSVFGLSEYFPIRPEEIDKGCLEFLGPMFFKDKLDKLAMERVGGDPKRHSVAYFNRGTAAGICSILTYGERGKKLLSLTPLPRSHPHVMKGAQLAGLETIEVFNIGDYKAALERKDISIVVITSVSPHIRALPSEDIEEAIQLARAKNLPVTMDDASGHGWRPALLGGPKSLEFDVDLAWYCLQKGNVYGPRLGVLAGKKEFVEKVSTLGGLMGCDMRPPMMVAAMHALESYDPEEARRTKKWGDEIYEQGVKKFGKERVQPSLQGGVNILEDDCLEIMMERAGEKGKPAIMPVEASCTAAMMLLEDYGVYTVASLVGAGAEYSIRMKPTFDQHEKVKSAGLNLIEALDASFDRAAKICMDKEEVAKTLFGRHIDVAYQP